MTLIERKQSPEEVTAKMVSLKLETAHELLSDPTISAVILQGIEEGKTDLEIARLIAPDQDPDWIAEVLRTARWKELIPGRSPEVDLANNRKAQKAWRLAHPEEDAARTLKATQAAADKNRGVHVVYTEEIRKVIEAILQKGGTYGMVAQALIGLGKTNATAGNVATAARRLGIPNQVRSYSATETQPLEAEILQLAEQGLTRKEIRQKLSHIEPARIKSTLHKHRIRTQRIDWRQNIDGKTLQQHALECFTIEGSYESGLMKLNDLLYQHGIPPVSQNSYSCAIRRALADKSLK